MSDYFPTEALKKMIASALENGTDVNTTASKDWTLLHYTAYIGDTKVTLVLIEKGADPNAKNNNGWTPLHRASCHGHTEIVKILIENGADPNAKTNNGWTSLHKAAYHGHLETVKILMENGADVNAKDDNEKTPFQYASQYGHTEIAKMLIEKVVALNAKEKVSSPSAFETQACPIRPHQARAHSVLTQPRDKLPPPLALSGHQLPLDRPPQARQAPLGDLSPDNSLDSGPWDNQRLALGNNSNSNIQMHSAVTLGAMLVVAQVECPVVRQQVRPFHSDKHNKTQVRRLGVGGGLVHRLEQTSRSRHPHQVVPGPVHSLSVLRHLIATQPPTRLAHWALQALALEPQTVSAVLLLHLSLSHRPMRQALVSHLRVAVVSPIPPQQLPVPLVMINLVVLAFHSVVVPLPLLLALLAAMRLAAVQDPTPLGPTRPLILASTPTILQLVDVRVVLLLAAVIVLVVALAQHRAKN